MDMNRFTDKQLLDIEAIFRDSGFSKAWIYKGSDPTEAIFILPQEELGTTSIEISPKERALADMIGAVLPAFKVWVVDNRRELPADRLYG